MSLIRHRKSLSDRESKLHLLPAKKLCLKLSVLLSIIGACLLQIGNPASIKAQTYELSVSVSGAGAVTSSPTGIDCGANCIASYPSGTTVTISINAAPGSFISNVSGNFSGSLENALIAWILRGQPPITNLSGTVAMNGNATLNVSFAQALVVSKSGSGSVSSSPSSLDCGFNCVGYFQPGQVVTLTATPASGATFLGWSGDGSGIGNLTLTMNQSHSVTANFTEGSYPLTITNTGYGSVISSPPGISCPNYCTALFPDGSNVNVTITASEGSYISSINEYKEYGGPVDEIERAIIDWILVGQPPVVSFNGSLSMDQPKAINVTFSSTFVPMIIVQPKNQTNAAGGVCTFSVTASGVLPLNYQWQFNGQNIGGATGSTLTLNSVTAANSGGYSVRVSNPNGSIVSATAYLAVLDDGANGNQPKQITATPIQSTSKQNLILVTHGWQPTELNLDGPPEQPWMVEMTNAIAQRLAAIGQSANWQIEAYYWLQDSWTTLPETALNNAHNKGTLLGIQMAAKGWRHVHLIAHSAGSGLIQAVTDQLRLSANPPTIQETFLDPYTGQFLEGRQQYGTNADWADDYFVFDPETDIGGVLLANLPCSTSGQLEWAYSVDVGGTLNAAIPTQYIIGNGTAGSTPPVNITPSHGSPIDFYTSTVDGSAPNCASGYGFPLSIEAGGSGGWAGFPRNNPPFPLCGTISFSQNQTPINLEPLFNLSTLPYNTSGSGVNVFGTGANMNSVSSSPLMYGSPNGAHPMGPQVPTNIPVWLAVGVAVTDVVNFVQFDAAFTSTNGEGLLTVYWNTNQIGMVDERVADRSLETYRFPLPNVVSAGIYTLSFRLDAFDNTASAVTFTNVSTGFEGVKQPIQLRISITNSHPLLKLTAAANFTYLVQCSSNLVDWSPRVLILNTNSPAQFLDVATTNANVIFYRALMP